MNIQKINLQTFSGNIKIITKSKCRGVTFDACRLENLRSTGVNEKGAYVGCAFEVNGKTYKTTNNIPYWDYLSVVNSVKTSKGVSYLPGLYTVIK